MFDHYRDIIPEASIRLTAIIDQAADSGMTVFSLIKRAMNEHQDFP